MKESRKKRAKGIKKVIDVNAILHKSEAKTIALNAGKCQNKKKEDTHDKDKDKKSAAGSRKVASKPHRYQRPEEGLSGEDSGLDGKVHGVREGAGEYEAAEGTPQRGEGSTRPLDSTRHLDTALGIKAYTEVSEVIAVSVAKTIEAIIAGTPEQVHITSEWICSLHDAIAGLLFPEWAGRFRDLNVQVGTHSPPPYFEVPVYMRLYCEDLATRLSFAVKVKDVEKISEVLAYADWRFQWIHPFRDFNGRVGRILLTAMLFKLRLPPAETASVEGEKKKRYLKALQEADVGDLSLLVEIWLERLSEAFKGKV